MSRRVPVTKPMIFFEMASLRGKQTCASLQYFVTGVHTSRYVVITEYHQSPRVVNIHSFGHVHGLVALCRFPDDTFDRKQVQVATGPSFPTFEY
jgi:hypothetical protein